MWLLLLLYRFFQNVEIWKSKIFVWLSPGCKTRRLLIKFVCAKTDMSSSFGRRKFACCIPGCNMVWLHLSVLYCTEWIIAVACGGRSIALFSRCGGLQGRLFWAGHQAVSVVGTCRGLIEHFNRTAFWWRAAADWLLCEEGNPTIITRLLRGLSGCGVTLFCNLSAYCSLLQPRGDKPLSSCIWQEYLW